LETLSASVEAVEFDVEFRDMLFLGF